jgi:hypothetical protein
VPLPSHAVDAISTLVAKYIERNRFKYLEPSASLAPERLVRFSPFFPAEVLALARFSPARPRLLNPAFYSRLRTLGIRRLPDLANVAAITFIDVIVHQAPLDDTLIFHELVHVEQYRQLGLRDFARSYVDGFLNGRSYENIPLERQAYDLDARFSAGSRPFAVEDEVRSAIARGDFGPVR